MALYRLSDRYALKGWRNLPYALVSIEKRLVQKISPRVCLFLLSCDGKTDLEDIAETESLLRRGVIERLESPMAGASEPPQYERCDANYRPAAQLAITGRCNLHCRHCLAADGSKNVSSQLTLGECGRIFEEMAKNHMYELWITGGEPLIHPDFRSIYQSALAQGLRVTTLFTNAWLVDDEVLDFIESVGPRPTFVVSFDGIGTHDWMRDREGAEQRTLEKITLLRRRGFPVRIGLNVNAVTAPGIIDTCRILVRDYGVTSLRLIYTSPTPRWYAALESGVESLAPGDYYDLMIELLRASRLENWSVPVDVIHLPKLHRHAENPRVWGLLRTPPEPNPDRAIMTCERAKRVLFIGSDGRVLPCSTYEGESAMLGLFQGDDINVLQRPLRDILTDSAYTREFETSVADLTRAYPICDGCEWLSICCGGCALYALGRQYVEADNPLCTLYRGGYATKYLNMLEETEPFVRATPRVN